MSAISQKSISGITSITTPAGIDDQLTLHTSDTSQAAKLDSAGNFHFSNHVNTTGITSASNFKTGSSNLHSTGLTVGDTFVHSTGVNASSMDIDDFVDVGNNIKLGNAGVITATSFVGDGSDLTNLPAGLGTALSATASSPLNKMYYTNQVLGVPSSVTVDVPASASKAYTQYADIKVESSADLIIAEGDDLIPDVLGLADFGTFGGGASAGRIRVNSISNAANDGSPTVQKGLVVTGVCTATSFSGDGSALTGIDLGAVTGATGDFSIADKIVHTGDTNTAIRFPSAGTVTIETGGAQRFRVDSNGTTHLTQENSAIGAIIKNTAHDSELQILATYANKNSKLLFGDAADDDVGVIDYDHNTNNMIFTVNANERLRIDSAGRFLKGLTGSGASRSSTSVRYPHFQLSSPWSSGLGSYKIECTDDYPIIFIDSNASYANGSGAGVITWSVKDSSGDYCNTASVRSLIDDTPSNDSAPGRLEFMTTTSGTTPTTKMTIDSAGRVSKSYQPFAMVHIQTTSNRNTTGSQIVVPWDIIHTNSTSSNVGNHFNTSNHRFTAPINGRYLFVVSLNIVGDNIVYHRINGANRHGGEYRITDNVWDHVDTSFIYDMNANDYYDLTSQLYSSHGQRFNGGGSATFGWDCLSIYLLG